MFERLARFCFRRRGLVLVAWVVALFGFGGLVAAAGTGYSSQFSLPNSEAKRGFDILAEHFDGAGGGGGTIVFRAEQGVTDPVVQQEMSAFFDEVGAIDGVILTSPYGPAGPLQISQQGPEAGKIAFARIDVPEDTTIEDALGIREQIKDLEPTIDGVEIRIGGQIFSEFEPPKAELIGLGFAIVVLILSFGSVLAMGLPIGVALAGIGVGVALIGLLSNLVGMPDFTATLAIMIGLGVGIDYALFIVTRYREQQHLGHTQEDSVAVALDTAGRAVTFAGITVIISLMGMVLMGLEFVRGLAYGASITVAVVLVASLTLLPALLGFAGHRVEVTRWRGLIAAGLAALALVFFGLSLPMVLVFVAVGLAAVVLAVGFAIAPLRKELPPRQPKPLRETVGYRWSRVIQRRPWTSALVGAGVLVVLALPVFGLRLGFSDEGNFPKGTDTREAYDLLTRGFGPGFNGPLVLVSLLPADTAPETLAPVQQTLQATAGVVFASPAVPSPDGQAVLWQVIPATSPQAAETAQLVRTIRTDVLPGATADTGLDVAVTGTVAANADFSSYLAKRLPVFFGAVLALSFLLLMVVFRSLLVPLKAVIMNLLSIGAAYGVVVAVFQWGWGGGLLGIEPAPIEPFVPMMMFAIVFGLSMDYEVFLLSRVKEEFDRTGDARESVADGLAATARVITAAAAIMVVVFGAFLLESDRIIKLFGVGLATAIFLDATVVRMLLVPATMELLGAKNWWLPAWLDRILPRINVEGPAHAVDEQLDDELVGAR